MENKQSCEETFKPLMTNDEIKKMERLKMELGENFKDHYWSLTVQDVELIAKDFKTRNPFKYHSYKEETSKDFPYLTRKIKSN